MRGFFKGWYPLSSVGRMLAASYACIPVYVATAQYLEVFPHALTIPLVGGMSVVVVCAAVSKRRGWQLFKARSHERQGFTLIELLVVISIIGILATILLPAYLGAKKQAQLTRAKAELRNMAVALERYANDFGGYPPDVSRGLPPGLEKYLAGGVWPSAVWQSAVFDWDSWAPSALVYEPKVQVYQISIRFCSAVGLCTIPSEPWAANFDYYSALYYCVSGPCRSHSDQPVSHPGYCINC